MRNFKFLRPRTVEEAIEHLCQYGDEAKLIAGGQSLLLLMREGLVVREAMVSLLDIPGLSSIRLDSASGAITLGALATHSQVEHDPIIGEHLPLLAACYRGLASVQVRNLGTLGGNLCHNGPGSDPPAALVALDASAVLAGPGGRRTVSVEKLGTGYYETLTAPDEVLEQVIVPAQPARSYGSYVKLALRRSDLPFVNAAVRLTFAEDRATCTEARIALGGVAPSTLRAQAAERALRGRRLNDALLAEVAAMATEGIDPITDPHASAEYRTKMTPVAVRRALDAAWQGALDPGGRR